MIHGWLLIVHEIGRAGQKDATVTPLHGDHGAATRALYEKYGQRNIRGGANSGTVGGLNGKVFQATHVWHISEVKEVP